jgi:hypothetical protein
MVIRTNDGRYIEPYGRELYDNGNGCEQLYGTRELYDN